MLRERDAGGTAVCLARRPVGGAEEERRKERGFGLGRASWPQQKSNSIVSRAGARKKKIQFPSHHTFPSSTPVSRHCRRCLFLTTP